MYVRPNFTGLTQPIYNPAQIQGNLQFYVCTPDSELNQLTPIVATAAASQFVQALERNTPMRIAAYNYVAQNGFVNDYFRDFITKCMKAAYVAMEQNQTTSIQDVCSRMLPEWINMYSAALAMNTPSMLSQLSNEVAASVQQTAQRFLAWLQETDLGLARIYDRLVKEGQLRSDSLGTYFQNASGNTTINHFQQQQMVDLTKPSGFSTVVDSPIQQNGTPTRTVAGSGYYSRKIREESELIARENAARAAQYAQESTTSVMAGVEYVSPYAAKLRQEMGVVQKSSRWGGGVQNTTVSQPPVVQQPVYQQTTTHVPNYSAKSSETIADIERQAAAAEMLSKEAKDFDDMVTDFSATPVKVIAPTVKDHIEKKPIISTVVINGETLNVVSILVDVTYAESGWKPNRFQPYFPCWCARTHEIIYVVADTGEVVAIPTPYNEEEANKMFKYEAHAINPHLGKPTQELKEPVREEAKILYSQDPQDVRVLVDKNTKLSTSSSDLVQQCAMSARRHFAKDKKLQMLVSVGINHEFIGSDTPEEMKEVYDQLRAVRLKVTYDSSAKAISNITSNVLREKIDKIFTERFNSLLRDRLGIPGRVDSYIEEAADAPESVRENIGDIFADALIEAQSDFIAESIDVVMAEEIPDTATYRSMLTDEEDIKRFLETSLFLSTNHLVMISRFTADELAIGLGEGASQLDPDNYPSLHTAISKALNDESHCSSRFDSITMHSSDGATYGIYRSALNKDIILIKAL